jgi:hypothetical protein
MLTDDSQHIYSIRISGDVVCATDVEIQNILDNGIPPVGYVRNGQPYIIDHNGQEKPTRYSALTMWGEILHIRTQDGL